MISAEEVELSDPDKVFWNTDSGMESMTESNKDVTPMSENFDDDEDVCQTFYIYLKRFVHSRLIVLIYMCI